VYVFFWTQCTSVTDIHISYSPSILTTAVSLAISQIFSAWPDLEIWVWGRSRSFKMARFDRACTTFYWSAIVTINRHLNMLAKQKLSRKRVRWRKWRKPINVHNNNDTLSIRIVVEKMNFQGLSEDADGDGWVTKLRGKSIPGQRDRWGKRPWTKRRCRRAGDEQLALIGRTQVCATGDGGERCAEPGEVRRCQTVQAFVGCQAKFKLTWHTEDN